MCPRKKETCGVGITTAPLKNVEATPYILQQPQPAICATYGIYHRRNCPYYVGNKQCSNVRGCLHKQQASAAHVGCNRRGTI